LSIKLLDILYILSPVAVAWFVWETIRVTRKQNREIMSKLVIEFIQRIASSIVTLLEREFDYLADEDIERQISGIQDVDGLVRFFRTLATPLIQGEAESVSSVPDDSPSPGPESPSADSSHPDDASKIPTWGTLPTSN